MVFTSKEISTLAKNVCVVVDLYKSKIFGPTCDSMDLIANEIMLPELVVGEWVYVENFGAYTTSACSSFNGFITTDYKYILRN